MRAVNEVLAKLTNSRLTDASELDVLFSHLGNIAWTKSMRRLFVLVGSCIIHNEPVLLVGETGTGKTTVCQVCFNSHSYARI
jgi:midasin